GGLRDAHGRAPLGGRESLQRHLQTEDGEASFSARATARHAGEAPAPDREGDGEGPGSALVRRIRVPRGARGFRSVLATDPRAASTGGARAGVLAPALGVSDSRDRADRGGGGSGPAGSQATSAAPVHGGRRGGPPVQR